MAGRGAVASASNGEVPTFLRYYHVFEEGELENMCGLIKDARVIKSFYDQGNWCVIIEKINSLIE